MNNERPDLASRAARHAALGDESRLRIVDLLAVADYSPGELQARVGIPSNLLAHHLGQLERAGLVERSRSEADRRRTYIHLIPHAVEGLSGCGPLPAPPRVLFVCTANSARSQLAAALWSKASRIPVASAGTHPADRVSQGALETAARHGLRFTGRRPRVLSEVRGSGDLLVTVCDSAHEELGDVGGLHWSIADPVQVGTIAAFDAAFERLRERIADLAPRIAAR